MEVSNSTPKREITIAKQVFSVPAPYSEGHPLTAEEANVMNQTLAENLRNNFAGRVKEASEKAAAEGTEVNLNDLQAELDAYVAEYSFGARRTGGGVAVDPVKKAAIGLARDAVKKALVAKGKSLKDFTAEAIHDLAVAAVERNPVFLEKAQAIVDAKKAAAVDLLGDIAA